MRPSIKEKKKENKLPPRAVAKADILEVSVGEVVTFDASRSKDVDSDTLLFKWNFGNEVISKEKVVTYTYSEPGDYNVVLLVSDGIFESYAFLTIAVSE